MDTTRREFLKSGATLAGTAAASTLASRALAQNAVTDVAAAEAAMPYAAHAANNPQGRYACTGRSGNTGEQVSLVGMGGFHIGKPDKEAEGINLIHAAIDRGINFMDNCWDYNNGNSEVRMGKALAQDGYRGKVFLMTKIDGRTKAAADSQLDQSLTRLQTDHIDLVQFHEIIRMEDPDRIFAKGGALEAPLAAKQAGKVRFIGFTGHKDPLVHRRMLEVADQARFPFRYRADARSTSWTRISAVLRIRCCRWPSKGIGVLGMKTFGDHFILDKVWPQDRDADRFAALLDDYAGLGGHYRHRAHGDLGSGAGCRADIRADGRVQDGSAAGPNKIRRPRRLDGTLQDNEPLRRHGEKPGLAG